MIASLQGTLTAKHDEGVVIEVNDVGFFVFVTATWLQQQRRVGQRVELHTHLCVRENDLSLYGFETSAELAFFKLLIQVSGIGPRTALAALSSFAPETLRSAIAQGDALALTSIPGIGRKTAQRLVLDLSEKIGTSRDVIAVPSLSTADTDVVNALTALGYSVAEAQNAAGTISDEVQALDERILAALQYLGRQ